jgi:hypothetical protein
VFHIVGQRIHEPGYNIMIQVLKQFFCICKPMAKGKSGGGSGRRARAARTDVDEAMEDAQAEVNDVSAALSTSAAAAGESAGPPESTVHRPLPLVPEPVLQRRLEKARSEKEAAIKEKEIMQKKMDEMKAQLDLAHSKVGDVVSVDSPITPSAGKVRYFKFTF